MTAQRNKVHHVTTIARLAIELGQSEEWLAELAEQMDSEDGLIWVYGQADDDVMAFSDDGIQCLREIIADHKERSRQ
jgi:predicted carbohydrate-binding protein with CBM5 and CBM33 domain